MKNKLFIILTLLIVSTVIISCDKNENKVGQSTEDENVIEVKRSDESLNNIKQYSDFLSLTHQDSFPDLLETLGTPVVDVETGIPFLIYEVYDPEFENKTIMLRLSFDSNNNLSNIVQVDQEGNAVNIILDAQRKIKHVYLTNNC